jgi:hypothetical protein
MVAMITLDGSDHGVLAGFSWDNTSRYGVMLCQIRMFCPSVSICNF